MFSDIAIVPIATMIIGAGFFFFIASIVGIVAEPFYRNTRVS